MITLVVGNGFDLEHELPTQYKDFLKFLRVLNELNNNTSFGGYKDNVYLGSKFKSLATSEGLNIELVNVATAWICEDVSASIKFASSIGSNSWVHYFQTIYEENQIKGEDWIDFENEISKVVRKLEEESTFLMKKSNFFYRKDSIIEFMKERDNYTIDCKNKLAEYFIKEMDSFISFLEKYISLVGELEINHTSDDIKSIAGKVNNLISFNYTDTFRRKYNKSVTADFVHGKANENNIILDIEETIENKDEISKKILCIRFKKYFQRIYKKTGLGYKEFLSKMRKGKNIAYFFGHSLSINDGDIIKYIVDKHEKSVFFYHNEKQHAEQIANLVLILGKDRVIEAANTKFEFRKQNYGKE